MRKIILSLILLIALTGCASLTKTQVDVVNQFAQTSKNFSAFPSKLMNELVDIRTQRGIYFANSRLTGESHIERLDSVFNHRKDGHEVAQKVDITFKIIDKYAQSLLLLSSDKFEKDLEDQAKKFGIGIDSLVTAYNKFDSDNRLPEGIGEAISQLITMGGKQYIRTKQAKEVKKFVNQADGMVLLMGDNLIRFLESEDIALLILAEERGLRINYLQYLNDPRGKATLENDQFYLELKARLDGIKKLRDQIVATTKELLRAHKRMLQEIRKRKTLKQSLKEIQDLYEDIETLKTTVQQINNAKH